MHSAASLMKLMGAKALFLTNAAGRLSIEEIAGLMQAVCEYTACRLLNGRLFQFLFRLFPDLFVQIGQCQCIGEFTHSFYGEIKIIHAAGQCPF